MTEHSESVTRSPQQEDVPDSGGAHPDLEHPTSSEIAAAVAASEEMNEADEVYAAELAAGADSDALASAAEDETAPQEAESPADAPEPAESPIAPDAVAPEAAEREAAEPETAEAETAERGTAETETPAHEPVEPESAAPEAEDAHAAAEPAPVESPTATSPTAPSPTAPSPTAPSPTAPSPTAPSPTEDALESVMRTEAPEDTTGIRTPADALAGIETPAAGIDTTAEPQPDPAAEPDPSPAAQPDPAPHAGPAASAPGGRPGGPRPTPGGPRRPSPTPRPVPQAGAVAPVTGPDLSGASDPSPWGRVDPAGTVYVRTADGEREVGFWQAGDATAGLAHYGRRYDDFMTEVVLLETRLAHHSGDPKAARTHAQMLRQSIDTLPAVGDLSSAAERLDAVITAAEEAVVESAKDRANSKAAAVGRREALCVEAEELAESNQWKASGDRLKEIVEEWRTIRGIDRKTDDLLWKRFSKARDTFIRRRGSHFAEMDKERGAARSGKEALIAKAEALSDSTDWADTATEYRNLMTEWKAAGRTSRDVEDALWDRFRNAQEKFFSRRQETFASRDAEFEANATVKDALLVEAEKINPANGLDVAKAALRSIQDRWEAAGKVPRERIRSLDGRLRAVEDKIKSAEDSLWHKTDPETTARLEQFRTRYESYQAQADKAKAAGDAKRASAAQAQADQWLEWLRAAENAVD